IRVFLLITPRMVPDMVGRPLVGRILQRPAPRNQQRPLDPCPALEAPMGDQPVIPHGNPQPRSEIQDNQERPVYPGIANVIAERRDSTEIRDRKQEERLVEMCSDRALAISVL